MNEFIEIRGARENNLKNVSLRIPKRKITIFTGRIRLRQVVDRLRHDRHRSPAPAERKLQHVRAQLPAALRASRMPTRSRT